MNECEAGLLTDFVVIQTSLLFRLLCVNHNAAELASCVKTDTSLTLKS